MRQLMAALLMAFLLLAAAPGGTPALAQESVAQPAEQKPFDSRRLLVPHKNADGSIVLPSFWQDPALWVRGQQQNAYGAMAGALRDMKQQQAGRAAWALLLISLAYGVFHAAGPGHGKAVISAWLLATRSQLRRGILIAFMSSLVQAVTAIVAVTLLLWLVEGAAAATKQVANVLESASFAMIALMGAYLLWPALKDMMRHAAVSPTITSAAPHFEIVNPRPAAVGHVHGPDCGCDHAHLPSARDVAGDWSWPKAFSMAFAVGLRPCTGALLVLVLANALGLYGAGVAATFAMSFGTFLTVSAVATLAVYARHWAEHLAGHETKWLSRLNLGLRLGGGTVILLFGLLLFWASLSGPVGNM